VVVLFVALLVSYPWYVLTIGSILYLASLPFGWMAYRQYQRKDAEAAAAKAAQSTAKPHSTESAQVHPAPAQTEGEERPSRLN
jgi:CDP-diacylglycerol--serine O-phosphatidyltransferase